MFLFTYIWFCLMRGQCCTCTLDERLVRPNNPRGLRQAREVLYGTSARNVRYSTVTNFTNARGYGFVIHADRALRDYLRWGAGSGPQFETFWMGLQGAPERACNRLPARAEVDIYHV